MGKNRRGNGAIRGRAERKGKQRVLNGELRYIKEVLERGTEKKRKI